MTQQPLVPEAAQSPYPAEEAPHHAVDLPPVAENASDSPNLADRASELVEDATKLQIDGRTILGVGAAVVLGTVATVTALLFSRRGNASAKPAAKRRAAAKPRPRTRKPPAKKTNAES